MSSKEDLTQQPLNRLELAHMLAKYYGLDRFEYLRPFPFVDTTGLSVDDQMLIQSLVANRILPAVSAKHWDPDGTMTRSAFAQVVAHANEVFSKSRVLPNTWLTPAQPQTGKPFVYLFNNNVPSHTVQLQDALAHKDAISAVGLTMYPWARVFPKGAAETRLSLDGTSELLTPMSAGDGEANEVTGLVNNAIPTFLVLGNYNNLTNTSDAALAHQLLTDPSQEQALLKDIVHIMTSEKLSGITIDMENLWGEDRAAYTQFVQDVHDVMVMHHWKTMVCLPERDGDSPTSAYDWRALAASADMVMLITYDEHTMNSKPGPISDLSHTTRVIQYAMLQMDPSKILVGVADYGYDWGGGQASEVSMDSATALAAAHHAKVAWDKQSQTPWFTYTGSSGLTHTVWFENQKSIAAIVAAVHTYGLKGIAVWHLGYENSGFWQAVQK